MLHWTRREAKNRGGCCTFLLLIQQVSQLSIRVAQERRRAQAKVADPKGIRVPFVCFGLLYFPQGPGGLPGDSLL